MRLLQNAELLDFASQYISPLDVANVQPTAVDICFGSKVWVEKARKSGDRVHALHQAVWNNHLEERTVLPHGFSMPPKAFILAETLEKFILPSHIQGLMTLRSWAAKSGLGQTASLTLKAGWEGTLILELVNDLNSYDLLLTAGCPLAQVQFFDITERG